MKIDLTPEPRVLMASCKNDGIEFFIEWMENKFVWSIWAPPRDGWKLVRIALGTEKTFKKAKKAILKSAKDLL